jgi:hypothetical protein
VGAGSARTGCCGKSVREAWCPVFRPLRVIARRFLPSYAATPPLRHGFSMIRCQIVPGSDSGHVLARVDSANLPAAAEGQKGNGVIGCAVRARPIGIHAVPFSWLQSLLASLPRSRAGMTSVFVFPGRASKREKRYLYAFTNKFTSTRFHGFARSSYTIVLDKVFVTFPFFT